MDDRFQVARANLIRFFFYRTISVTVVHLLYYCTGNGAVGVSAVYR